jgi:DNA-directed RNA polymerase specialized sigma54-like protein
MAMRLNMQQGQRLIMTPLLQQAIQLLQLSTLELEQVVRKELEENPLLEELPEEKQEVDGEAPTATSADGTEVAPAPAPTEPQSKETSSVDGERVDDLPFDLTSAVFAQQGERTPVSPEERMRDCKVGAASGALAPIVDTLRAPPLVSDERGPTLTSIPSMNLS